VRPDDPTPLCPNYYVLNKAKNMVPDCQAFLASFRLGYKACQVASLMEQHIF